MSSHASSNTDSLCPHCPPTGGPPAAIELTCSRQTLHKRGRVSYFAEYVVILQVLHFAPSANLGTSHAASQLAFLFLDASFGQTVKTLQAQFTDILSKISQRPFQTLRERIVPEAESAESR